MGRTNFAGLTVSGVCRRALQPAMLGVLLPLLLIFNIPEAKGQAESKSDRDRWLITGKTMGPVPYSVVIASPSPSADRETTESQIAETLDRINRLMSTYKKDSDVSWFNRSDSTDWI